MESQNEAEHWRAEAEDCRQQRDAWRQLARGQREIIEDLKVELAVFQTNAGSTKKAAGRRGNTHLKRVK